MGKIKSNELSIFGGNCDSDELVDLLEKWSSIAKMPNVIWEYTDEILFEKDTLPQRDVFWLERGKLFGEGGDLSIRRDGDIFRWWFIGPSGVEIPEQFVGKAANWHDVSENRPLEFDEINLQSLLWGDLVQEADTPVWFENRVAGVKLAYPVQDVRQKVLVEFTEYRLAGNTEFVWFNRLVGEE